MTLSEIIRRSCSASRPPGITQERIRRRPTILERLHTIAEAIALEAQSARDWRCDQTSLAAATLVWYSESRFALEGAQRVGYQPLWRRRGSRPLLRSLSTDWCGRPGRKSLTGTD